MGIKAKIRPLQFKNVNASFSNKELIQKDSKTIKLLKKSKVNIIESQDKYSNNNNKDIDLECDGQINMKEVFDISSQLLSSNKNDNNDDDIFRNTISLLNGSMDDERKINILHPNYNLLEIEERYVTKIPQYMSKKSIDYFSLSILQETTIETEDKNGSPKFVSTPIYHHNNKSKDNKIIPLDKLKFEDIDRSSVWDMFNSSQIENYPRILPPPLISSNGYNNYDNCYDEDDMIIIESDSSLNDFYRSYEYIPKKHFNIHTPLKILYPEPSSSSSSSVSF